MCHKWLFGPENFSGLWRNGPLCFILNYNINKNFCCRLCKAYDEISDKVQEMPDNTSDLVALTQFLENASTVTVVSLQNAVDKAGAVSYTHLTLPTKLEV